jgi:hypothetical protein
MLNSLYLSLLDVHSLLPYLGDHLHLLHSDQIEATALLAESAVLLSVEVSTLLPCTASLDLELIVRIVHIEHLCFADYCLLDMF